MRKKVTKAMALVLLVAMLATLPGLAACGGGDDEEGNKIIFGWDWDFTGRAALGTTQLYAGLYDYVKMTKEENPVPGVEVDFLTYDGKSDPARVTMGYKWLKDRGMDLFSCAPHDFQMFRSTLEEDNIPSFISSTLLDNLDAPLCLSEFGPPESQLEVIMQWMMDNWDVTDEGRKCKVGFVGLSGIPFYEGQRDEVVKIINENPDKLELTSVQMAPSTTTAWATEIAKVMPSDYVAVGMSGPPLASFVIEARNRGFDKWIVGPLESLMAFWPLVKAVVPPAQMANSVSGFYFPWWTDTGDFIAEAKAGMMTYRSEAEVKEYLEGTGYLCGWAYGMILIDALRRAADKVGGENVTGMDLFEALKETNMTVDGFGGFAWKTTPKANAFMRAVALFEYNVDAEDWRLMEDYVIPPSLSG